MRRIESIIADLDGLILDEEHFERLVSVSQEIERHEQGSEAIVSVLRLFERYPNGDFGMPGPLAHAIERYYGNGYEEALIDSMKRKPTGLTIWLANRIVNANDSNRSRFLSLLRETAGRDDIEKELSNEARHFCELHR